VRRFGCTVHTFDCTVGDPPASSIPSGIQFHPWCVGGLDEMKEISSDMGHKGEIKQYYTLKTIYDKVRPPPPPPPTSPPSPTPPPAQLGHHADQIDLLKMDIERHEFPVLIGLDASAAPRQMAFEVHLHNGYGMFGRPASGEE
jgi:hypothetical protein